LVIMVGIETKYKSVRAIEITPDMDGREIRFAGWVHRIRDLGGKKFVVLRDGSGLIQMTVSKDRVSEDVWRIVEELTPESVVAVRALVRKDPRAPRGVEIVPLSIEVLSIAKKPLPLDVSGKVKADLDTRLKNRPLDLRRLEMQAIERICDTALSAIRRYLRSLGFVEVFTPKIIAAATEGGANLFPVFYFGRQAFLAQSPQLYKELLAGAFERVFEIGPAWRSEESDTPYHLAEFISVDIEAAFMDYHDVMNILEGVVKEVIKEVEKKNSEDLEILKWQLPEVKDIPRISYEEALEELRRAGLDIKFGDDIGTPELRVLHNRLGYELAFITDFPSSTRPFYTKPRDDRPELSESFDLVWRHLEIASGSTRIHRKEQLIEEIEKRGLSVQSFEFFIKWFDYGMPPHAGWGLGLSRFLLMLTGKSNVKEVTLFPRDKKRLVP